MFNDLFILSLLLLPLGSVIAQSIPSNATPVPSTAEDVCPLKPGMSVPSMQLAGISGVDMAFPAAFAERPAVLIFYRGGWCPFCNVQLGQLQSIEDELRDLGFQLIGISPDTPENLEASVGKHELSYTLLSDSRMEAARRFGVAFQLDDAMMAQYREYGLDLEAASGETHHMLPVPAVFIVNTDGRITFSYANPDYKVRLDPSVLLAAARAARD
ncbi:MAG: peroxiredoxin-like family protein [Bacteroidota bacterium]|nr:peroxiredoxin-like family protein [Bacteroidota bacterium]